MLLCARLENSTDDLRGGAVKAKDGYRDTQNRHPERQGAPLDKTMSGVNTMKHYRKSETLQEICDLQSETLQEICDLQSEALQSFLWEVTA